MKRILIIRCGAIGDTIFSTAIIDALRTHFGKGLIIDWVATSLASHIFNQDDRINTIFTLNKRKIPLFLSSEKLKIVWHAKKHPYDLVINLEDGKQFHSLVKAIKTSRIISKKDIQFSNQIHEVDIKKAFLHSIVPEAIIDNSVPRLIAQPLSLNLPKEYIVINPSNSHLTKSRYNYRAWPLEYFKTLIEKLHPTIPIIIIGAQSDAKALTLLIQMAQKNIINLIGKTSLNELISVINHAKALITTDTGPSHIAAAVNTPVFTLIGPTDHLSTGPYPTPENEVHIIAEEIECRPCYKTERMKECSDNICMQRITPERVYNEITTFLQRN
jgi:ADP-heptose:LPS heptosyltransferase